MKIKQKISYSDSLKSPYGYSESDRLRRLLDVYILRKGSSKQIWKYPGIVNHAHLVNSNLLDGYFLDFSKDADFTGTLDSRGVPLVDYAGRIGLQYNPFFIGHYALACFEKYREGGSPLYLERFLKQADWLASKAVARPGGFVVWEYGFAWARDLIPPWISSLAQATAISVLLRAWLLTQETRFRELARQALVSLDTEIRDGGVKHVWEDNTITFEESAVLPPSTVLNGFIFSIWGVWEFFVATGDLLAGSLVEQSVKALVRMLPNYDLGFWSKYSLSQGQKQSPIPNVASWFYHSVHTAQLEVMAKLFPESGFDEYAARWRWYEAQVPNRILAFIAKGLYKVLVY